MIKVRIHQTLRFAGRTYRPMEIADATDWPAANLKSFEARHLVRRLPEKEAGLPVSPVHPTAEVKL